ncbi:hypothetical protein ON010_g13931 [Phytophthora cinnamomi]|nr:hypothetical protein ON010_g13931 [Phytophthora cinnamomi]
MLRVPARDRKKTEEVARGPFLIKSVYDNGTVTLDTGSTESRVNIRRLKWVVSCFDNIRGNMRRTPVQRRDRLLHGTSALAKNASYTWQGQVHAETEGYYIFSFAHAIPKWENPDYGSIFAIGTSSINGTEVGEGYRLYGDGGVKPWINSIATRDNWDNIKSYVYLEVLQAGGRLARPGGVHSRSANIQLAVDVATEVDTPIVFAFANSPAETGLTVDDGPGDLGLDHDP